ncbi:MAG: DsbA family protein [Mariprofundaceae bacterium]|nr:DsbA family protein [Mariprofundaceae bacterium]
MKTLYYIHDPMCSWCWAFAPVWQQVQQALDEDTQIIYLLGGLAPDNQQPMPQALQHTIQNHWRTIQQQVPGIMFNFDFWQLNTPMRSTYPACRAVIAAKLQDEKAEQNMILAIQQTYYLQAKNPSLDSTLIHCAQSIALDIQQFETDCHAENTQSQLLSNIKQAQSLQAFSFPSLVFKDGNKTKPIRLYYIHPQPKLYQLLYPQLNFHFNQKKNDPKRGRFIIA